MPGSAVSSLTPVGNTPSYVRTTSSAAALRASARRLYPMPCHAASTSAVPASASANTLGNRSSHSAQRVSTRATCVCCSITSDSQISYGSWVRRHGRSRYRRTPSVRTSVRKGSMFISSSLLGNARQLYKHEHPLEHEAYSGKFARSANLGSTAGYRRLLTMSSSVMESR